MKEELKEELKDELSDELSDELKDGLNDEPNDQNFVNTPLFPFPFINSFDKWLIGLEGKSEELERQKEWSSMMNQRV